MKSHAASTPFFGRRVVAAAFVLAVFGWGLGFYGPPVYLQSVREMRDWSVVLVSSAVTLHFLVGAIVVEICGTFLLKLSNGFERWHWGWLSILCYALCFAALAPALKTIPVGVAYAVWSGVGIVAAALIGLLAFSERLGPLQLVCIALILVGAVGLRLTTVDA